jgi:hypothetical protein
VSAFGHQSASLWSPLCRPLVVSYRLGPGPITKHTKEPQIGFEHHRAPLVFLVIGNGPD